MVSDGAVEVVGRGVGDSLDFKAWKLSDGIAYPKLVLSLQQGTNAGHSPSLGSATASETFFSSLIVSRSDARRGVTLPSTSAATSSSAVAALSNFWKFFNFRLWKMGPSVYVRQLWRAFAGSLYIRRYATTRSIGTYRLQTPSAVSVSAARSSRLRSFLSLDLSRA